MSFRSIALAIVSTTACAATPDGLVIEDAQPAFGPGFQLVVPDGFFQILDVTPLAKGSPTPIPPGTVALAKIKRTRDFVRGSVVLVPVAEPIDAHEGLAQCRSLAAQLVQNQGSTLASRCGHRPAWPTTVCQVDSASGSNPDRIARQVALDVRGRSAIMVTCNHDRRLPEELAACDQAVASIVVAPGIEQGE